MVTVFGLGFVGLTTALGFAQMGHKVYGIEANAERMQTIRSGKLPFLEPGLDDALIRHLGKKFIPTDDISEAVRDSQYIYYCVGTPYGESGQADLTYLLGAVDQTLDAMGDARSYKVLVTKSTIPPSTTSKKICPYIEAKGFKVGRDLGVANNPEFLREGHCWEDFTSSDRIVLGVSDVKSEEMLRELYKHMNAPIHCVSLNTGEFIKYLSNTLLATLISYSNEMAVVADTIGDIDVANAFRILVEDKRWGGCNMTTYVYPGCGYGGYCLPKDTNALYAVTKSAGFDAQILRNVIATNDSMPDFITDRIAGKVSKTDAIGIMGLSFKPLSDDVRDTPPAKIIQRLLARGYTNIFAYDPVANEEFKKHYPQLTLTYCESLRELVGEADTLVIMTAWEEFRSIRELTDKPVIDCRFML